jgi:hypothetical protein
MRRTMSPEAERRQAESQRRWQEGLDRGTTTVYTRDGEVRVQPTDLTGREDYYGRSTA